MELAVHVEPFAEAVAPPPEAAGFPDPGLAWQLPGNSSHERRAQGARLAPQDPLVRDHHDPVSVRQQGLPPEYGLTVWARNTACTVSPGRMKGSTLARNRMRLSVTPPA
jgi:hypothetical protein